MSASVKKLLGIGLAGVLFGGLALGQVTSDRILHADREPQNWLTYNGNYNSNRFSGLNSINTTNVANLELKWAHQVPSSEKFEATPLVVDGVMYVTEPPNDVSAIDAHTGRPYWTYHRVIPDDVVVCCGRVNRGLAILDGTLFMATLDAHLVALDAATGRIKWETKVGEYKNGYSLTVAPLVVKDKLILGLSGGERGISGFLAAYDAKTGKEVWKFHTIPQPGEPNFGTWAGDSWKTGGGSGWITGSYDPDTNSLFWGTGNPGPDWNPFVRAGLNLYTDCVLSLDPDTGKLKWFYQFTPNDEWDYDAVQIPVLADLNWRGRPRKVMLWGNRNGFFYVLDRTNGEFLLGKPFVKQTWAKSIDDKGKVTKAEGASPSVTGTEVWPGVQGGTNWYSPSFSPKTQLFYVSTWVDYHTTFFTWDDVYQPGKGFTGGMAKSPVPSLRREPYVTFSRDNGYGAVRAINPITGEKAWDYEMLDVTDAGILTTAGDVLFSGNREGHFFALDTRTGKELWKVYLGGQVSAAPMTYRVNDQQFVSIAAGHAIFTFGLRGR